jgi:hypothetical protein
MLYHAHGAATADKKANFWVEPSTPRSSARNVKPERWVTSVAFVHCKMDQSVASWDQHVPGTVSHTNIQIQSKL